MSNIQKDSIICISSIITKHQISLELKKHGYVKKDDILKWIQNILNSKEKKSLLKILSSVYPRNIDIIINDKKVSEFYAYNDEGIEFKDFTLLIKVIGSKLIHNIFYRNNTAYFYFTASLFNHSCDPNCEIKFDDTFQTSIITSLRQIEEG